MLLMIIVTNGDRWLVMVYIQWLVLFGMIQDAYVILPPRILIGDWE